MEVRRSRHGKTALVIGGNAIVKILGVTANGPQFDMVAFREFRSEYNTLSNMSVDEAVYSFIGVAKRAYKHNQEVCDFLWEQIVAKNLSEMTLSELVLVYNGLAKQVNKPERKTFDSKGVALDAIAKLDEVVKQPTPIQEKAASKSTNRSNNMSEQTEGQVAVEKKPRGKGIGARAAELILEGKTNQEVIDTIKAEIEGANPTNATIAWYKNKLRQEGKLAKPVKKEKAAKTAEVEVADEDEDEDEAA